MGFLRRDAGLRLGRGLISLGAAEKEVIISDENSVSAEDESDPYPSSSLSSRDDESEEDKVDEREPEGISTPFLSESPPNVRFLYDLASNTPNPRFWKRHYARVVDTGHSTYHLNVLLHTIVNMLHIYTAWVCLCLLLKDSVRCFNLGKEGLDARQNWLRGLSCHCTIQERNIKNIRSMGGAVGEVLRSPKSNFSGGEQILADDEASSFSR